jgi:ribonuclease E
MTKRLLIDASHAEETRVVVLDGNRLEDFDVETQSRRQLKGNIYLAKVVRVEPSLQAAFVEYGGNRHGFLAFGEIHPDYYQIPVADRQRLIELQEEEARAAEAEAEAEDYDAPVSADAAPAPGEARSEEAQGDEARGDEARADEAQKDAEESEGGIAGGLDTTDAFEALDVGADTAPEVVEPASGETHVSGAVGPDSE